jgi:hypothetical protein
MSGGRVDSRLSRCMSSFVIVYARPVRSREVIYHEVFDATHMTPAEYSAHLGARYHPG